MYSINPDNLSVFLTVMATPDANSPDAGTTVSIPTNLKGPAGITDRDGNTCTFAYNESFQPTSVTRPDICAVLFQYAGWRLGKLRNARTPAENPYDDTSASSFDYDGGHLTGLTYPNCQP